VIFYKKKNRVIRKWMTIPKTKNNNGKKEDASDEFSLRIKREV
tara:strand:+ start:18 stop:146 length:129 start_codon:yes stop_codon:yes gene_type:complete